MKKIFITRAIRPDGDFHKTLSANGLEVHGESLVGFMPVPVNGLPAAGWLFFYSKNGIRFLFQQVPQATISNFKLAVIGQGSAEYLERVFRKPDFVGEGDPVHTAIAFLNEAKGERVVFIRAHDSKQSVQQLLGNKIISSDLVVYDNQPRTNFDLPDFDCLVFTSPLNAQAYFSKKQWKRPQKIVAIGQSTAAALAALGIDKVTVADSPSEESLAKAVLAL